jgi:hypothetical protein
MSLLDIGEMIYEAFTPLGWWGMLLCIFVIFYIDAILFPTLPELFTVIIFMAIPELWFGASILLVIAIAETLGLTTLYLLVKRVAIPNWIRAAMDRYRSFLLISDERIILVNRIAPMLPFMGAFVGICDWSYRRSLGYTLLGGMVKYGLIIAASGFFFTVFSEGTAQNITLLMVLAFIALSIVASMLKKRRMDTSEDSAA